MKTETDHVIWTLFGPVYEEDSLFTFYTSNQSTNTMQLLCLRHYAKRWDTTINNREISLPCEIYIPEGQNSNN